MAATATVLAALVCAVLLAQPSLSEFVPEFFGRSTTCAPVCEAPTTFQYTRNMVHVFDYHASAKFLSGSREPQLGVTARAHITIAGPCEMILALSHVRLADSSDPNPEFSAALVHNPLRFGFDDGRISAVCSSRDEPLWVLNFKRALLSTFQNSMKDFERPRPIIREEIDVTGNCTSNYTSIIDSSGLVNVTRARASSCVPPPVPESPSLSTTLLRLLPLFEREQKCLQVISGGTMKEATCRENVRYPSVFGGDEDLPVASLTTRLKLSYQFKADFVVVPNFEARRSTLAMEWESDEPGAPSPEWLSIASGLISRLMNYAANPVAFYRLTQLLKTLDYDKFQDLFISIDPETWEVATMAFMKLGTDSSLKLLLDFFDASALPWGARTEVIPYLLKNSDLSSNLIDIIQKHYSYGFDENVMVKLKKYCQVNPQCDDDEKISELLNDIIKVQESPKCEVNIETSNTTDELESPSGTSEPKPQKDKEFSPFNLRVLKNFASLGRWNDSFDDAIFQCSQSDHQKEWYGALEAIRSSPCSAFDYSALLPVFKENLNDSYRQIMIYRTIVRCPNDDFKSYVIERLNQGEVDQVTSYIWTHLSNLKNEGWAAEIVKNSRFISKYRGQGLKFSRNFKKNFVMEKKTYTFECNVIFSGFSLRPQYLSFNIFSDERTPSEILEIEFREANQTVRDYSGNYGSIGIFGSFDSGYNAHDSEPVYVTQSSCMTSVKVMGNKVYSREHDYGSPIGSPSQYLFGTVVEYGTRMLEAVSVSFISRMFMRYSFEIQYYQGMDVDVFFPTSIGLPFHLKVNCTKGYHSENIVPSYAKQFEGAMYIDAHYTNVGSKLITRFDILPGVNVSKHFDRYQVLIELPEVKTTLANFELGIYNMENDKLTPRVFKNETRLEAVCIPGLKEMFGSTICLEYCPKSSWWPIYNLKYHLIYEKQDGVQGHNISVLPGANSIDIAYEVKGSEDLSWRIKYYELAQFLNLDLQTPFFALSGSGTYNEKVFELEQPGLALNMSGVLRSDGDAAPFTLIGETATDDRGVMSLNANFNSRIFESKILAAVEVGDNTSVQVSVPYKLKNGKAETIDIDLDMKHSGYVYETRALTPTSEPSNFTRHTYATLVTFSEFPQSRIDIRAISEDDRSYDDFDTYSANLTFACEDKSLTSIISAIWSRDTFDTNCSHIYERPDHTVSIKKNIHSSENTYSVRTTIDCNEELVFEGAGEYGATEELGIYSNASFTVPLREPDARYPLMQITFDQNFNVLSQHYHIYCRKSYRESSLLLNFTSDVLMNNAGVPQGFDKHVTSLEVSSSAYDPFLVSADSQLSASLQDLDLSVAVQTPFSRWDKEAFKLKLKKKGDHLQTSLTENRRDEEATVYELQGSVHHNVINDVLDWTKMNSEASNSYY